MKNNIKFSVAIPFLLVSIFCHANDGAFRVNGNQLIPIRETDISVRKEILSIKAIGSGQASVDVYYEFFNPGEAKELEVGFEAFTPQGDVDAKPVKGGHPYITGFSVTMNGQSVPYKVAIVGDSLYFRSGKYKTKPMAEVLKEAEDNDLASFFYVYHFRTLFKKGLNIIHHTYVVDLSSSVEEIYSFQYVLTAAGRWANRQIDDFTLHLDMGDFQDLSIANTFFKTPADWQITGTGKQIDRKPDEEGNQMTEFFIRRGSLIFQKKNFKPVGELYIHAYNSYDYSANASKNRDTLFNYKKDPLPFSIDDQDEINRPANELSKTILKNLPFARRGYVFRNTELSTYYYDQKWYLPDPAYVPDLKGITRKEQLWLKKQS
jgi:YARHG domain